MKKINRKLFEDSGRRGGLATKKTHGTEHFKRIGSKGGSKPKKKKV